MEERQPREARTAGQAHEIAETLNKTVLTVGAHAGEGERLFGSVTAADVADAIWQARRVRVDKRKVRLDEPIKTWAPTSSPSTSSRASRRTSSSSS